MKRNFAPHDGLLRSIFAALSEQARRLPRDADSRQIAPDAETGESRAIHVRSREADAKTTRSIEASSRHRGNTVSLGAEPCGSTGGFSHTLFIMAHIEYQP